MCRNCQKAHMWQHCMYIDFLWEILRFRLKPFAHESSRNSLDILYNVRVKNVR